MRSRSAGAGEGAPRLWGRAQLLGDGSGTGKAAIGRDRGRHRDPAGVAGSTPRAGRRPLGGGRGGEAGRAAAPSHGGRGRAAPRQAEGEPGPEGPRPGEPLLGDPGGRAVARYGGSWRRWRAGSWFPLTPRVWGFPAAARYRWLRGRPRGSLQPRGLLS